MRHNRQLFSLNRRCWLSLAALAIACVALSCDPSDAIAGGRRPRLAASSGEDLRLGPSGPLGARVSPQFNDARPVVRPAPGAAYSGRYPKFQGGFHSRELQNIGVPSGDVGLRGNGFSAFPW